LRRYGAKVAVGPKPNTGGDNYGLLLEAAAEGIAVYCSTAERAINGEP